MDVFPMLLMALIGLVIGILLATLVSNLRGTNAPDLSSASQNSEEFVVEENERVEILRLLRGKADGGLSLEINGQVVEDPQAMEVEQVMRLQKLFGDFNRWICNSGTPETVTSSVQKPQNESAGTDGMAAETTGQLSVLQQMYVPVDPAQVSTLNPLKSMVRAMQANFTPKVRPKEESIAQQIDDILQKKLSASPYADRVIRLMELPGRGMVILIGKEHFNDVEDIPEEPIRELIRSAASEWEAQMLRSAG